MTQAQKHIQMDHKALISELAANARAASQQLAISEEESRNAALRAAARVVRESTASILSANTKDVTAAEQKGLDAAMLDRLKLDEQRIEAIATGLEAIAELPDPVAKTLAEWDRPSGLHIQRVTVPLGVIGIIYESRPNVTADAGALCIKSGNAAILRGGSESYYSSQALVEALHKGLREAELPELAVQLIPTTDREAVGAMLQAVGEIDIIVPRGGKGLTSRVQEQSRVPTILHLDGNCHSYIHSKADIAKAVKVITNAKMRRTGICGATESVLIDREILAEAVPALVASLKEAGCSDIRADEAVRAVDASLVAATEEDWGTEYLAPSISMKAVDDVAEAVAHINRYGSHHTDAIMTEDAHVAARFQREVDSAIVMHNTSTQFADGGEFGMGAEIGISTGRLHARGPVGADQLVTYKYVVTSEGAVRP